MTKIIFGVDVPYPGFEIDWEATDAKRKKTGKWLDFVRVPCVRIEKELSFELCDICGEQVVGGRLKRRLTTCCPEHNAKKWDAINGLIIEQERNLIGERPYHFWQTISLECFERDNFTCTKCNRTSKQLEEEWHAINKGNLNYVDYRDYHLECHHHIPLSKGGTNKLENLRTRCGKCHKNEHSHEMNLARRHYQLPEEY